MNAEMPIISVVVCTHNRLRLLRGCLDSLLSQHADPELYEILVVDNCSTDGTGAYLEAFIPGACRFRWVVEPVLGLSNARNRGWREARGRYVAYIDDDAEAHSEWISEIIEFISRRPEVPMFGGPYRAFTTDPVPSWFPPEYGSMNHGSEERALDIGREFIQGMNMAFNKGVLAACGGFHPGLGMKGNMVSYGEETQLQFILRDRGHQVYYLPKMKVNHYLPAYKMCFSWLLKSLYSVGATWALTSNQHRTLVSHLAGLAYGVIFAFGILLTRKKIPFRRKLYYSVIPVVSEFGALREHLKR